MLKRKSKHYPASDFIADPSLFDTLRARIEKGEWPAVLDGDNPVGFVRWARAGPAHPDSGFMFYYEVDDEPTPE